MADSIKELVATWQQASVIAETAYKAWDVACQEKGPDAVERHGELSGALAALHAIECEMRKRKWTAPSNEGTTQREIGMLEATARRLAGVSDDWRWIQIDLEPALTVTLFRYPNSIRVDVSDPSAAVTP